MQDTPRVRTFGVFFYQVEFGLKRKRSHPVVRTTYLEGHIQPQ